MWNDTRLPDILSASHTDEMPPCLVSRGIVACISFLTLVDLFAAQAILPTLASAYHVSPAQMGLAVNAATFGMAAAGLFVAVFGRHIGRRSGIAVSLLLLAVPTLLLATMPPFAVFAMLRVTQGALMATAFSLTMAYIAERGSPETASGALAAYVTGNVASNLLGRLASAALADHFGLSVNFIVLASLNVAGAWLVFASLDRASTMMAAPRAPAPSSPGAASGWLQHLSNPPLVATFFIGFLILFAFIGTFTYVNFVLVRPPLSLGQMSVGFVYFVFVPALVLTPLAGRLAQAMGPARALMASFVLALSGLPLLLSERLPPVLAGLALVGAGTFAAQAIATGFVGRLATGDKGSASGLYLASYYLGGLAGSAVLGPIFESFGWGSCVGAIGVALGAGLALTTAISSNTAPGGLWVPDAKQEAE